MSCMTASSLLSPEKNLQNFFTYVYTYLHKLYARACHSRLPTNGKQTSCEICRVLRFLLPFVASFVRFLTHRYRPKGLTVHSRVRHHRPRVRPGAAARPGDQPRVRRGTARFLPGGDGDGRSPGALGGGGPVSGPPAAHGVRRTFRSVVSPRHFLLGVS